MSVTDTSASESPRPFRDVPKVAKLLIQITGHTARNLGEVSGLTESQMSERLNGKTPIKVSELAAWADFLGVDPGVFFANPTLVRERLLRPENYQADQGIRSSGYNSGQDTVALKPLSYLSDRRTPKGASTAEKRAS